MKVTLEDRVLEYLQENGSINPKEALNECGSMRLSAIIFDLKKEGYDIETIRETSKNKWGDKVSYAKYVLKEEK